MPVSTDGAAGQVVARSRTAAPRRAPARRRRGTRIPPARTPPRRRAAEVVNETTYRWHAANPNRRWIHAITRIVSGSPRSSGRRGMGRGHGRGSPGRQARSSASARACTCRMLADLEARQVEPERLGLPDQVLQLPVRLPGRPGGGQRRLDQPQVGQELPGRRRRRGRRPGAGGRRPFGRVQQVGAVGLAAASARMISAISSGCAADAAASARRSSADGGAEPAVTVSARPIRPQAASSARSACSAWIIAASLVTAAVTVGLPSRSPPTQDAEPEERRHRRGRRARWPGRAAPGRAPGRAPAPAGTASRRTRSSPSGPRPAGVIPATRSCAVRHSRSISSRSRRCSSRLCLRPVALARVVVDRRRAAR